MSLVLSREQRDEVFARWFERIVDQYPVETARFLREQSDPFANPVGVSLRADLGPILDGVLEGCNPREIEEPLDRIVRVRALQDMTPSQAVAFVLELKEVFCDVAVDAADDTKTVFDARVDQLLLVAFDVYSRCREQVFEIRVREIHNRSLKVMERLNAWRERRAGVSSHDA